MKVQERFLKYVTFDTKSSETSGTTPSTPGQLVLSEELKNELVALGLDAESNKYGYVYAKIPASAGYEDVTPVGFIAHVDTSPEFSGKDVKPKVIPDYDGGDVPLGCGLTLKVSDFPYLPSLKGRTLITASGDTLLGADDKAGVAEIMALAEALVNGNTPHGTVCIAFTPDEEIGEGPDHFDIEKFGAKYAYTLDGDTEGEIEYENFNACAVSVDITGFSVHPGTSKDTMINASLVAMEFNSMLPSADTPRNTEKYQGFYHLCSMEGGVSEASMKYIIRDHDPNYYDLRKETVLHIAELLNDKYGDGTVKVGIKEQYRNMREVIDKHPAVIEKAVSAVRKAGLEAAFSPVRGGTDGARISYMGIPCPNLGTGGNAYHGPYEHVTVEGMEMAVRIILGIVDEFAAEKQ